MVFLKHRPRVISWFGMAIFIASLLSFVACHQALADTYGRGQYGNCIYDQGCPPASSPTTSTPVSTPASVPDEVLLNNFTEYSSSVGKQLDMGSGQFVFFNITTANNTIEKHKVLVNSVGSNYVDLTLSPNTINARLFVGQTSNFDVNSDGQNDIAITLSSINYGQARLIYVALSARPAPQPVASQPPVADKRSIWWIIVSVAVSFAILLTGIIIIYRQRHQRINY